MILCDKTIKKYMEENKIEVSIDGKQMFENIQPASIDISIGNEFLSIIPNYNPIQDAVISMNKEIKYVKTTVKDNGRFYLKPHKFILATTREFIKIPNNLAAWIEGRSSIGRIGLFIQNAGWIDPSFGGQITLELYNANDCSVEIKPNSRVGQIIFAELDDKVENPYNGKYQNQMGVTGSKIYLDD